MSEFRICRVDSSQSRALEPLGTKPKFWFTKQNERFLFKSDARGTGEDWAEVIVAELCELLGLPHVSYEFAHDENPDAAFPSGVVCKNMAPAPGWLTLGNQLLLAKNSDYPAEGWKVRQHTVAAVSELVQLLHPPARAWCQNVPDGVDSSRDFYAGYLLIDAWVANQDRHHENWGAIWQPESGMMRLAPTFDHGSSLARNLTDTERADRLTTKDGGRSVELFATKARSALFGQKDDTKPLKLIDAFSTFAASSPVAALAWLRQLELLDLAQVQAIVDRVPQSRMSTTAKEFTVRLLHVNQQRLVDLMERYT